MPNRPTNNDLSQIGDLDLTPHPPSSDKEFGWLEDLPTTTSDLDSILSAFPASVEGDAGVPIHTRVPASWLLIIDQIREQPGTILPNIWPTRSDYFRWCLHLGTRELYRVSKELNTEGRLSQPMNPTLRARIFLEQEGGEVTMRADTMIAANAQIETIAKAVDILINVREITEAVDLVNTWLSGASAQDSPFWRSYIYKLLVDNDTMKPHLRRMIMNGLLHDTYLLELAEQYGIMDVDGPILRNQHD